MHIVPLRARRRRGLTGLFITGILAFIMLVSGCGMTELVSAVAMPNDLTRIAPPELSSLKTIGEYQLQDRRLTFVSENGAVPHMPMPTLVKAAETYTQFAGQNMTGNVSALDKANPLEATTGFRPQKRQYVVFSSNQPLFERVKRHEAGTVVASGWGFTITSDPDALVAVLRVPTGSETPPPTAAPETEMCQLTLLLTATPASVDRYNAHLVALGAHYPLSKIQFTLDADAQELYCNSIGRATEMARSGLPYQDYRTKATADLLAIDNSAVPAIVFDQPTYDVLALRR